MDQAGGPPPAKGSGKRVWTGKLGCLDSVSDSDELALAGTFGVAHARVGDRVFVFAAGENDDGLTVLEWLPGGRLMALHSVFDDPDIALDDVNHLAVHSVGGRTFLYANSQQDNGLTVFQIGTDGALSLVQVIRDSAGTTLGGAIGEMAIVSIGTEAFLLATGESENGLTSFRIDGDGRLEVAGAVTDDMFGRNASLGGARGVTTATVGQTTFAIVAGFQEDGIAVFEMNGQGGLTHRWSTFDAISDYFELNGAIDVASAAFGEVTYVIGAGAYDDGISVFRLREDGYLTHVSSLSDGIDSNTLNGAEALETFTTSGETFLAVSAYQDDAITVFHLGRDGQLTELSALRDTIATTFGGPAGLSVDVHEGRVLIFAGGLRENGMSVIELGGGNNILTGTNAADLSFGFSGDDTIVGSPGADTIAGGAGRDVLSYAASNAAVRVDLSTGTGTGDAEGDVIREIEFLQGSLYGDTLVGGSNADELWGDGGDDFIFADGTQGQMTAAEVMALLNTTGAAFASEPAAPDAELVFGFDPLLGL